MTEPIETHRVGPASQSEGALAAAGRVLGISPASWRRAEGADWKMGALTAVGGWVLMAWNRFGAQGVLAPRPVTRFVLIGLYAWLGLALVTWLLARIEASPYRQPAGPSPSPSPGPGPDRDSDRVEGLGLAVVLTGLAHRPLVIAGVAIQVLSFVAPGSIVGSAIVLFCFGFWMPAMLVGARSWAADGAPLTVRSWATALVPYGLWLVGAGWFLSIQVGHLI